MKIRSGLLGFLLTLFAATPVLAQDEEGGGGEEATDDSGTAAESAITGRPAYISLMGSYFKPDKDRGVDSGAGGMIAVGKRMTDGLHLELNAYFLQADAKAGAGDPATNGKLELKGAGVTAMLFPLSSYPDAYLLLSVGPGSAQNHPGTVIDYSTTYFHSGLGYLYPLGDKLLLRAEARYQMDRHNYNAAGDQSPARKNGDFYDGIFNLGVLYTLGTVVAPAAEEAPAEVVAEGPLDSDNDGIPDDQDKCPGTPAGAIVNEEGCESDADGDGVPDREDKCADSPAGAQVGPDGCPLDSDGDGVPDALDECPNSPAGAKVLANGCALKDDCRTPRPGEQVDENGCAVDKSFILKGVNFEFDSDRLTPEAKAILNQVAETLQAYPDINVEIAGHTDGLGSDAYNLGLSERRSISVKNYLTGQNVDAARMTPTGYGETQPIDSNESEEGQSRNRRVELRVIEDEGAAAAPVAPEEAPADAPAPEEALE